MIEQEYDSPQKVKQVFYRTMLLTLLGLTRVLARADIKPPSKWFVFFESVRTSSDMLHVKLSSFDEEVGNEFIRREEILDKRMGKEKFYSTKEIKELKEKSADIKV